VRTLIFDVDGTLVDTDFRVYRGTADLHRSLDELGVLP
jgi:FMN phosphatase YigB (HAD superfamily)